MNKSFSRSRSICIAALNSDYEPAKIDRRALAVDSRALERIRALWRGYRLF